LFGKEIAETSKAKLFAKDYIPRLCLSLIMMKSGKVRAVTVDHFAKFKNQYAELKDHK
jgi:hypothetical protein